jgi:hypothetical protein
MQFQISLSQDNINIDLTGVDGIALCVSGGLDSGTLLYCLAETITKHDAKTRIYAITTPNRNDSASGYYAGLVVAFVKRKFPNIEIEHIVSNMFRSGGLKAKESNKIIYNLYRQKKIQVFMDGVTMNPKTDDFVFIDPQKRYTKRIPERDTPLKREEIFPNEWGDIAGLRKIRPWNNIDKKGIAEITQQKNITTRLLFITKSCTDQIQYKCGTCWWCQERAWAFNIDPKRIKLR